MFILAQILNLSNPGSMLLFILAAVAVGVFIIGLAIFLFILWIMMLVDALTRNDWQSDDERIVWTIILIVSLFVQLWGIVSIVYYFVIKRSRSTTTPSHQEAQVVAKPLHKKPKVKSKTKSQAQAKTDK